LSLWINSASWSTSALRGNIRQVTFKDITLATLPRLKKIEFLGFDATHKIDSVLLQQVKINGLPIQTSDITTNPFVSNLILN